MDGYKNIVKEFYRFCEKGKYLRAELYNIKCSKDKEKKFSYLDSLKDASTERNVTAWVDIWIVG